MVELINNFSSVVRHVLFNLWFGVFWQIIIPTFSAFPSIIMDVNKNQFFSIKCNAWWVNFLSFEKIKKYSVSFHSYLVEIFKKARLNVLKAKKFIGLNDCAFFRIIFWPVRNFFTFIVSLFSGLGAYFLWVAFQEMKNPNPHFDFLTAFGSCFIAATLFYSAGWNVKENKKEASKFYLLELRRFLEKAVSYISATNNNCVCWHRCVDALKSVENLYEYLTEDSHKKIFSRDYKDTGFAIAEILDRIESDLFFYGVPYQQYIGNKDAHEILYCETGGNNFGGVRRIHPNALKFLCAFYEKVNKLHGYDERFSYCDAKVLNQSWFEKIDVNFFQRSMIFNPDAPIIKKIYSYIDAVNSCESK